MVKKVHKNGRKTFKSDKCHNLKNAINFNIGHINVVSLTSYPGKSVCFCWKYMNIKDLQAFTLVGPTRENLVPPP